MCDCARARGIDWRPCMGGHGITAQVHHLATATRAATAATAADDTMSALVVVLGRNAHLADDAVYERLGVRPMFLTWLVRLLSRVTLAANDICSFRGLRLLGLFVTTTLP